MTAVKPAPVVPAELFHYTCRDHGKPGIEHHQQLLPHRQPLLSRSLVWLTDLETPDAWALGLTNYLLCCDRTQIRVTVHPLDRIDASGVHPWWYYRRTVHPALREAVEQTGLPMHWWVSEVPLAVHSITSAARAWGELRKAKADA